MSKVRNRAGILVAENNTAIAQDLKKRLEALEYIVNGRAASVEQTIKLVESKRPDIVIMNPVLKGGMESTDAAKAMRDRWGVPVIFIAPDDASAQVACSRMDGPCLYLVHPFQDREIQFAINTALYGAEKQNGTKAAEAASSEGIDIFQHKDVADKVAEQEHYLRTILQTAQDGFWIVNREGYFTDVNEAYCAMSGYSREEFLRLNIQDIDTLEKSDDTHRRIKRIAKSGSETFETSHRRKDGSIFDVEVTATYIAMGGGQFVCFCRDISARKKIERELRESEERYRSLFTSTIDGVCLHEMVFRKGRAVDYRILDVNPTYESVTGIPKDVSVGALASELYGTGKPPYLKEYARVAETGEPTSFETFFAPMGKHFLISVYSPGPGQFATVFQDITARKKLSLELERIFNLSLDMLCIADINEVKFLKVNPAFTIILGHSEEELLSGPFTDFVHPEDLDVTARVVENQLRRGKKVFDFENRYRCKDGNYRWLRWVSHPIPEEGITYAIAHDITKAKQDEEERQQLEEQLKQAHKMEAIGTLAGGIAHDFNNLLQAIGGYTELLLLDKPTSHPDFENMHAVMTATQRAAKLVEQLLLFSRKAQIVRRHVDINREVEAARKILERTIPKMIDIEFRPGPELWAVAADPVQIEQIFLNLGSNAADAMPDGGKIVFETQNIILDEGYSHHHIDAQPGRYVQVTISDTGHGMDKETVDHIFEPFFTTKVIGKGTGLGLATVYGIVKSHGGNITCYSEIGQGTSFKIYLPAMETMEDEPEQPVVTELPPGGSETILIVDDEEAIRDFASQILKRFGYTVLAASSGEEALEVFSNRSHGIDLVILDISMPGMGGYKCLQGLLQIDPSAKVLVASGYAINGHIDKAMEAGAAEYAGKPYHVVELLSKVRAVLDEQERLPE